MVEAGEVLAAVLGPGQVVTGAAIANDYGHDEALGLTPRLPAAVAYPQTTAQVARLVAVAREHAIPLTARGSGTGLSGACIPVAGGAVVSFERMSQVLEIDTANHVAVVQPGVSLAQLDAATAPVGLVYPVFPGEKLGQPRRQRGYQRRRHAGRQVRGDPASGPRPGSGTRNR